MQLISALAAILAMGAASTAAAPAFFNPFKPSPAVSKDQWSPAVSKDQCFSQDWLDFKYKKISFECGYVQEEFVECRNTTEHSRIKFYTYPGRETVTMYPYGSKPNHLDTLKEFMHEYAAVCNPGAEVIIV